MSAQCWNDSCSRPFPTGILLQKKSKGRKQAERTAMISCHIILDLTSILLRKIPDFPVNKNNKNKCKKKRNYIKNSRHSSPPPIDFISQPHKFSIKIHSIIVMKGCAQHNNIYPPPFLKWYIIGSANHWQIIASKINETTDKFAIKWNSKIPAPLFTLVPFPDFNEFFE